LLTEHENTCVFMNRVDPIYEKELKRTQFTFSIIILTCLKHNHIIKSQKSSNRFHSFEIFTRKQKPTTSIKNILNVMIHNVYYNLPLYRQILANPLDGTTPRMRIPFDPYPFLKQILRNNWKIIKTKRTNWKFGNIKRKII